MYINEKTIYARLYRRLAKTGWTVHKTRDLYLDDIGHRYFISNERGQIVDAGDDLKMLGQKYGCVAAYEQVRKEARAA